jgi:hypothetical protein
MVFSDRSLGGHGGTTGQQRQGQQTGEHLVTHGILQGWVQERVAAEQL